MKSILSLDEPKPDQAAALGLTRLLTKLLFEVEPADPLTIIAVSILLALVATIECWIPAHRSG